VRDVISGVRGQRTIPGGATDGSVGEGQDTRLRHGGGEQAGSEDGGFGGAGKQRRAVGDGHGRSVNVGIGFGETNTMQGPYQNRNQLIYMI
jgi:hypothetical protein